MSEENNGVFRNSAFGGFNKKDVLAYIDSMSSKYEQEKSDLTNNISRLEEINKSLELELGKCKNEISVLSVRLEDEEKKLSDSNASLENLKNELQNQSNINHTQSHELSIQTELCEQLRLKIDEYESKVRSYEKISLKINRTIEQANQSAANIVSEAEKRASSIISNAHSKSDSVKAELTSFRDEINDLRALVKISLFEVEDRLSHIDSVTTNAINRIDVPTSQLGSSSRSSFPRTLKRSVQSQKKGLCDTAFDLLDKLVDKWAK